MTVLDRISMKLASGDRPTVDEAIAEVDGELRGPLVAQITKRLHPEHVGGVYDEVLMRARRAALNGKYVHHNGGALYCWLTTIATRAVADFARAQKRALHESGLAKLGTEAELATSDASIRVELKDAITEAVNRLPPREQVTFALYIKYFRADRSQAWIIRQMCGGCPRRSPQYRAARRLLRSALARIRAYLRKQGF